MKVLADFYLSELLCAPSGASSGDIQPAWSPKLKAVAALSSESKHKSVIFCKETDDRGIGDRIVKAELLNELSFFQTGPALQLWLIQAPQDERSSKQPAYHRTFSLQFSSEGASTDFAALVKDCRGSSRNVEAGTLSTNIFDEKIEAASAKMYFHYYGQLLHQQNMLQDYIRTGTYYAAVLENRVDFEGKVVIDVGAGSGILSLFAAQAGAQHVYAVEASPMAEYAKKLAAGNPAFGHRITVVHGKVEEIELPEKADVLISEPMGTLLVNERMLESYVIARDRFLKPEGKMFPCLGRVHMAPFSDEYLYVEIANKALFWQQPSYYGVDLTPLYADAFKGYFSQPVVDAFDPRLLVAAAVTHTIDFKTSKEEDLYQIDIPLNFKAAVAARVHGLACWFDVLFNGSTVPRWLSTAPGAPTTHWYQLRCVLSQPLYVMAGQQITGRLHLVAHSSQSYTIYLTMAALTVGPTGVQTGVIQTSEAKLDLKEPYYRMSQSSSYSWAPDSAAAQQQPEPSHQPQGQAQDGGQPQGQAQAPHFLQHAAIQQAVLQQQHQHMLMQQRTSAGTLPQPGTVQQQQQQQAGYWQPQ